MSNKGFQAGSFQANPLAFQIASLGRSGMWRLNLYKLQAEALAKRNATKEEPLKEEESARAKTKRVFARPIDQEVIEPITEPSLIGALNRWQPAISIVGEVVNRAKLSAEDLSNTIKTYNMRREASVLRRRRLRRRMALLLLAA